MTETSGQEQSRWVTTVIMSTALQNHEISTILQRQQHRVRYSDSVEPGSVIFSLSGVAFILSDAQDLLMTGEEEFSQRIQKFMSIHRNSFLVLSAALHGPEEWNVMLRIQKSWEGIFYYYEHQGIVAQQHQHLMRVVHIMGEVGEKLSLSSQLQ
ncbi:protein SPO16 homolog isoform 2-T2 [Guaruba guarouba]